MQIAEQLARIFNEYDELEAVACQNAGQVLELVRERGLPAAIILDRALVYGSALEELEGDLDPDLVNAGIKVVRVLREMEGSSELGPPRMLAVITHSGSFPVSAALRSEFAALWAEEYLKPYDTISLEVNVCRALGVTPKNLAAMQC